MPNPANYIERLLKLISKDRMKEVLDELQTLLKGSPAYYEVIQQSARYSGLMKEIHAGILTPENSETRKNQLRYALTDMVRELEEQLPEHPTLQQEVEQYLKERSTHNEAHITGDGNINVQGVSGSSVNIQQNDKTEE